MTRSLSCILRILSGILIYGFLLFSLSEDIFAKDIPFTDVSPDAPYYSAIAELYDARIIADEGDHLFHPNDLMNRDFFISLAMNIGCHECRTPTSEEMIQYSVSPFIDISKTNIYYYCIAAAKNDRIAQGYITDLTGKTSCENGEVYTSNPFCPANTISRIEAAAVLLRQANLWNDTLNASVTRTDLIPDVTNYWYGYAKKALEIGIITKKSDGTIGQDEKITRGEFARMAARTLQFTQCNTRAHDTSLAAYILIKDKNGQPTESSVLPKGSGYIFEAVTSEGNWNYSWTAKNENGDIITGSGKTFDADKLDEGKWFVSVDVIDPITGEVRANPSITVTIVPPVTDADADTDGDGVRDGDDLCILIPGVRENAGCPLGDTAHPHPLGVALTADPLVTFIDNAITFTPHISGASGNLISEWDYGDSNRSKIHGITTHAYSRAGYYTVTLMVTDPSTGNSAQARVSVEVTNNKDTDGDGVFDQDDLCPEVQGSPNNRGCPDIEIPDYNCIVGGYLGSGKVCAHADTDGDGIPDDQDLCPKVFGQKSNNGCPITGDTDGDGVPDSSDQCPTVVGPVSNHGCPLANDFDGDGVPDDQDLCPKVFGQKSNNGCPFVNNFLDNITSNICLANKIDSTGLVIGAPVCNICPCANSLRISSTLRECDVVFASILSSDRSTVYSRGNFYLIQ